MDEQQYRINGRIVKARRSWRGEALMSREKAQEIADKYNEIFEGTIIYWIEAEEAQQ